MANNDDAAAKQSSLSVLLHQSDVFAENPKDCLQLEDMSGEDAIISGIRCLKFAELQHKKENSPPRKGSTSPLPKKFTRSPASACRRPESAFEFDDLHLGERDSRYTPLHDFRLVSDSTKSNQDEEVYTHCSAFNSDKDMANVHPPCMAGVGLLGRGRFRSKSDRSRAVNGPLCNRQSRSIPSQLRARCLFPRCEQNPSPDPYQYTKQYQ
jgi:hypothetical protein